MAYTLAQLIALREQPKLQLVPPPAPADSDADAIRAKLQTALNLLDAREPDWHKIKLAIGRAQSSAAKLDTQQAGLRCPSCKAKAGHKLNCRAHAETLARLRADQQLLQQGGIPIGFIPLIGVDGHLRPTVCRWPRQH